MGIFYVLVLSIGVSMDALAAGVAYGLKEIQVPLLSLVIVGLVTGLFTAGAMVGAQQLGESINSHIAVMLGAFLLLVLGFWNILLEYLTRVINQSNDQSSKLTVALGGLLIEVMAKPEAVDIDNSNSISSMEAVLLGIALGMDNMVATFAASMIGILPDYTPLVMAGIQILLITTGIQLATCYVPDNIKRGLPYVPGIVLMVIGFIRLV
ncbi:MAG TPA: manganese efflux pump [Negativicutes bacterium]